MQGTRLEIFGLQSAVITVNKLLHFVEPVLCHLRRREDKEIYYTVANTCYATRLRGSLQTNFLSAFGFVIFMFLRTSSGDESCGLHHRHTRLEATGADEAL